MDWQQIVALLIVAGAAFALAWGLFAPKKFKFAREGGCGCGPNRHTPERSSIVFRARKGERPTVTVKMR